MRAWLRGLLVVALVFAGFALKGHLLQPPSLPSTVAPGEFDSARALGRLESILGRQNPHPVDSRANDEVRDRLITELRMIGLEPVIQDAVDCSALPKSRIVSCSRVRNVIATIPGVRPGPALLLNAHYDSTPTGTGAADDGIGVATMLEVASILQDRTPARPVILLFNEGEEFGLNGASAFVRKLQPGSRINALINMEARGVSGPAMMFETSNPNGGAIAIYAGATRRPYANSLSTDFARLIPNTTDVVEFKPAGWTLLNYAIIGNETRYHTPGDNLEALDQRSLHHMGSEVLAAVQGMAATDDPASAGSTRMVFTDIAGLALIRLPLIVAAAALGLLLFGASVLAWRRNALGKPLLLSGAMWVGGTAAAGLVSFAATVARAGDFWRAYPLVTYVAIYAVLLAAMVAIWGRWGRGLDRQRMRPAVWLLTVAIGAMLSLVVPGATIFFLIAPAIALAGIALSNRALRTAALAAIVATIVQFVMFAELLASIETLLIDGPLWAVAPLGALAALPALVETNPAQPRPALLALLLAAAGLWLAALVLPRGSADRPAAFTVDYFHDVDLRKANFAVASKQAPLPPGFTGEWHRGILPYNGRTRWIADAPLFPTPAPQARLIASVPEGEGRRVRLALSPGGGNSVAIRFAEETSVLALGVPGQLERIPAKGEPDKAVLRCSGRSCDGIVIEALLGNRAPVKAELFSTVFNRLPEQAIRLAAKRPANAHEQYGPNSTITLKRIRL